jgi:hypothetical protein
MYLRIDPSQSALSDLFILDKDDSYSVLTSRQEPTCTAGYHQSLPNAILVGSQQVKCIETGDPINTLIYKI